MRGLPVSCRLAEPQPRTPTASARDYPNYQCAATGGAFVPLASSAAELGPGGFTLTLRLRHELDPNRWRDAAIIPVLRASLSETGEVSYEILGDVLDGMLLP